MSTRSDDSGNRYSFRFQRAHLESPNQLNDACRGNTQTASGNLAHFTFLLELISVHYLLDITLVPHKLIQTNPPISKKTKSCEEELTVFGACGAQVEDQQQQRKPEHRDRNPGIHPAILLHRPRRRVP
ncbi:uncharacterized, partial [Tachysurus ichikawai]